jgi:Tfp pilus assembly protein PilF
MGRLELQLGRAEATKERAEKVLASRPDSVQALLLLGQGLRALGQLNEAEANLRRGLELSPSSAELHNELGAVLAGRGAVPEAEASFREAIELDPEAVEARVNLARLLEGEEAEGLLREAIRLRPEYAAARVELAKRLAERGEVRDADVHIQAALRASPDDPEALFVAARIAELLGRRSDAASLYRRFLELASPDLAEPKRLAEERLAALTSR